MIKPTVQRLPQKYPQNSNLSPLRTRKNQVNSHALGRRDRATTHLSPYQALNQAKEGRHCTTHPDKIAEYSYSDEEEQILYCCVCAAKLASQGFHLMKIATSHSRLNKYQRENSLNPKSVQNRSNDNPFGRHSRVKCTKYSKNILIKDVENLAQDVEGLLKKYNKLGALNSEDNQFDREKELVLKFYEKLQDIVAEYQRRHLQKLEEQRGSSETELKNKIQANIHQLRTISQDMLSTDFDQVIQNVSEGDFKQCCEFYRNKYEEFSKQYGHLNSKVMDLSQPGAARKKFNVTAIQATIDQVEKLLKQFYDPNQKFRSKSSEVQNFLREYEKASKNRVRPTSYFSNNPDRQNSQQQPIKAPQFTRF